MNMNVDDLISRLEPLKKQGVSPLEAVRTALPRATVGAGLPAAVAQAVAKVFGPLTPAELAIILRNLFPHLSAVDIGAAILVSGAFPGTTAAEMLSALTSAGFDANTAADAVNVLYPITVTVQSNQSWQDTGLNVTGRQITRITAQGSWVANPPRGRVGPGGHPAFIAISGYTLPGAPDGALISRIGNNAPFVVGTTAQAPAGQSGPLQLCINDDLDGIHGAGLRDNSGTLQVRIATQPR